MTACRSTSRMARASSTSMEPGPFLRQRATTQSILEVTLALSEWEDREDSSCSMTGRLAGHVVMSVVLVWLVAGYGWHCCCCRRTSRCGTCRSSCCCPPQSTRWVGPSLLTLPGMDWLGAVRSLMTTTYFPCCLSHGDGWSSILMPHAGPDGGPHLQRHCLRRQGRAQRLPGTATHPLSVGLSVMEAWREPGRVGGSGDLTGWLCRPSHPSNRPTSLLLASPGP